MANKSYGRLDRKHYGIQNMGNIRYLLHLWFSGVLFACFSSLGVHAQMVSTAAPVRYSWMPNQITVSWIYTRDDYALTSGSVYLPPGSTLTPQQGAAIPSQRITLSGVNLGYAYRKSYPWEIVATYRRETGNPLEQKLTTYAAGVGYVRQFGRYAPFGDLQVGAARTSSSDYQYLFISPQTGIATLFTGGVDVRLLPRWGARAFVENQYLPFGSTGSVYWSAGVGIFFRFEPQH